MCSGRGNGKIVCPPRPNSSVVHWWRRQRHNIIILFYITILHAPNRVGDRDERCRTRDKHDHNWWKLIGKRYITIVVTRKSWAIYYIIFRGENSDSRSRKPTCTIYAVAFDFASCIIACHWLHGNGNEKTLGTPRVVRKYDNNNINVKMTMK